VRKIIDSNSLRSTQLIHFLQSSPKNIAVLSDYAAMEAYSGQSLSGIYRSMEVVSQFPNQVEVLKGTAAICGLRGRSSGLRSRMVDKKQTKDFAQYVRSLRQAQQGDTSCQLQLLDFSREANAHLAKMLSDADTLGVSLFNLAKSYSKEDRRCIREGEPYSESLIKRMVTETVKMAAQNLAEHPNVRRWPSLKEVANTFVFRYCLCGHLLAMDWVGSGGAKDATANTLRNDLVDANFAAYGTFFDGVMTNDNKLLRIYIQASEFISIIQRGHEGAYS
jgi:hypothetical protein